MLLLAAMRRGESRWSGHARLIAACAAILLAPLLVPLLVGRVFTRDDFGALHLPFRFLYQDALTSGHLLLWTPAYHKGFFLFGAGETGMAHPWHLALYRFLPLGPAFNLEIASSYVSLFAGTALLWRRLGLSREGALFGAMLFAFSGFTIFNAMHVNHIGAFAHAPWMLLAAHVLMTARSPRTRGFAFAGLAIATGLQLLAGNPQYVWLTAIAMAGLVAWSRTQGASWGSAGLAILALGCGGLIGAVQIVPTLDFLRDSTRAAWSPETALTFSLSPLNLIQLWSPFAFEFRVTAPPSEEFIVNEFVVYNGAFCTAAVLWVAANYKQMPRRPLLMALLAFAAINLLLAFGRHGGIYSLLLEIPGIRSFRAPARHLLLVHLAMSGVAGLVLDDLLATTRRSTRGLPQLWPLYLLISLAMVTAIAGAALSGTAWAASHQLRFSPLLRAAPWTAMVVAVSAAIIMAARGRRGAMAVVIVLSTIDLGAWGYSYLYRWNPIRSIDQLKAEATAPAAAKPGDVIRTYPGGRDAYAILRGIYLTRGYTGLYAQQILDPQDPATERLAGLTWEGDGERWQPVADVLPRARLLASAIATADPRAALPAVDPRVTALVESPLTLSGPPGTAAVRDEEPGRFEVETDAGGPQLLVMTERFHRGWVASIDGRPATKMRVYGDFLGCVVPAGKHRVSLVFSPPSVRLGLLTTIAGLAITLGAALWLGRRPLSQADVDIR